MRGTFQFDKRRQEKQESEDEDETLVAVDGLVFRSNPTMDFVRDEMRIGGLRTQQVASRFEKLGYKTAEDFAEFTPGTVSDSDLKYVWMLEKTEVRKIREACALAREQCGLEPYEPTVKPYAFGQVSHRSVGDRSVGPTPLAR